MALVSFQANGTVGVTGSARLTPIRPVRASGSVTPSGNAQPGVTTVFIPSRSPVLTVAASRGSDLRVSGLLSRRGPLYNGFALGGNVEVQAIDQTTSPGRVLWTKVSPHRDVTVAPVAAGTFDVLIHGSELPITAPSTVRVNVRASSPYGVLTWSVGSFMIQLS